MRKLRVLAVGRLKERYLTEGCAEYLKRLGAYSDAKVVEVPEFRLPERPSPAEIARGIEKEGESLLERLSPSDTAVALCIEGRELSSRELSEWLECRALEGRGSLAFLIGGSYGLSEAVKSRAALRLSMSRMTFPHQLARLMLLEQLYRALNLSGGGKYHK